MVTPTLNHTLPSRGSRAPWYCSTVPKMRLCECLALSFSFSLFCPFAAHFEISAVNLHLTPSDFSPQQLHIRGSTVLGPDRSGIHLDCVQSHDWQPGLYPWGRQTRLATERESVSLPATESVVHCSLDTTGGLESKIFFSIFVWGVLSVFVFWKGQKNKIRSQKVEQTVAHWFVGDLLTWKRCQSVYFFHPLTTFLILKFFLKSIDDRITHVC